MKKRFIMLLASFLGFVLYSQQMLAKDDQCLLGIPIYTRPLVNGDYNSLPVYILADKTKANYPEQILFSGNVNIKQGNSILTADEVLLTQYPEYNHELLRTITAIGNVHYDSHEIKLQGFKAWSNLKNKDTNVYQGYYQMVGRQGRGTANIIKQRGNNRYTVLENGNFTFCLPGDESWSIGGSEVIYDRMEQVAKIWNARFKIGKVPIFYSPYLQMPVGDKRRSGFLIHDVKYGSSNNGFELNIPYYLNLAPNYDATITPNYISKRGTNIKTEFRYRTTPGDGLVEFNWLPKDRFYRSKQTSDGDRKRWMLYWSHNGDLNKVWHVNIDYTKISDSSYFDDLDSKYGKTTDNYVKQNLSISYTNNNWDTVLSYKQFKIFDIKSINNYRSTPQLDLTYYKNNIGPFHLKVFSQAVKFTNINNNYPEATRLHIEPTINFPLVNIWGSLNTEAKLMVTHYQQDNIDIYNQNNTIGLYLKGSVNRLLPQFKTDYKMMFERRIYYLSDYTQTLETQLQYRYIPYRNQKNIGIYDSTILKTESANIFSEHTYSSLDHILSVNKLASSLITRVYDDHSVELFNASVGQIYYFSRSDHLNNFTETSDIYNKAGSGIWAGSSYWCISKQWGGRGSLQYDSRMNSITLGDAVLEYRRDENRILQLNYRYASQQYVEHMLSSINHPNYQQGISQLGIIGSWPLVNHWSLVGAYYYDTKANQPANQLLCLQYNTCCWAINLSYERKIAGWNNAHSSSQYDNKLCLNIELRGLSSNDTLSTDKMLGFGMIPYQRAF